MTKARASVPQLRSLLQNLALGVGSVVLTFVAFEIGAQALVRLGLIPSASSMYANTIPDDLLRVRLPPLVYPEIDARGYRNDHVPDRAEVVALGDSQTYGYNAYAHQSWPKRFQERIGTFVYNMGVGNYGPAQYYALLDDALAFEPHTIVVGFYLGNDLADACRIFWEAWWRDFARQKNLDTSGCHTKEEAARQGREPLGLAGQLRGLHRYSQTLMMIKQIPVLGAWFSQRRDFELARTKPEAYYLVEDEELRTVVRLQRLEAMRQEDPSPRNGRRLTEFFYGEILERLGDVRLIVLFIPTKANVLYERLLSQGRSLPPRYHELVATERELVREFTRFFERRGAETADALDELQRAVAGKTPVFLAYADGHPTPQGYDAMAKALFDQYVKQPAEPRRSTPPAGQTPSAPAR